MGADQLLTARCTGSTPVTPARPARAAEHPGRGRGRPVRTDPPSSPGLHFGARSATTRDTSCSCTSRRPRSSRWSASPGTRGPIPAMAYQDQRAFGLGARADGAHGLGPDRADISTTRVNFLGFVKVINAPAGVDVCLPIGRTTPTAPHCPPRCHQCRRGHRAGVRTPTAIRSPPRTWPGIVDQQQLVPGACSTARARER